MPTLTATRRAIAKRVDRYYLQTTATSGSTTSSLEVAAYPVKNTRRGQWWLDGWALRPAKTNADRVTWLSSDGTAGSGNATGALGVTPNWASSPYAGGVGETVELYSVFSPDEIEAAINAALARMMVLEETAITGVNQQLQYALASYTWLVQPSQVVGLKLRTGTTASQYGYRNVPGWYVTTDEQVLILNLSGTAFTTNDTLILTSLRDYASIGALTLEADTTTAPLDWLTWEAIYDLYRMPTALRSGALAQDEQNREEARVRQIVQALRNKYAPRVDRSIAKTMGKAFGPSLGRGVWG